MVSYLKAICSWPWGHIEAFGDLRSPKTSSQQLSELNFFKRKTLYIIKWIYFAQVMLLNSIFLCSMIRGMGICSTKNLYERKTIIIMEFMMILILDFWYFEHVPPKIFLLIWLLSEVLQTELAEVWIVDEAVFGDCVGNVEQLLIRGVQSQHLHSSLKIL